MRVSDVAETKVCIFAAVERELAPLRARSAELVSCLPHAFVVTGVGKASAASAATAAVLAGEPPLLLQVGCAGAYPESGLEIGDVVLATSEVLADEGALTPRGFIDLRELGLPILQEALYNEIPTATPPAPLWEEARRELAPRFRCLAGRLATVSAVSGTDERAAELAERWQPLAESMEGAAVALVARKYGCPFVEVRGISNLVGAMDRPSWNIDDACEHAAEVVALLLRSPSLLSSSYPT